MKMFIWIYFTMVTKGMKMPDSLIKRSMENFIRKSSSYDKLVTIGNESELGIKSEMRTLTSTMTELLPDEGMYPIAVMNIGNNRTCKYEDFVEALHYCNKSDNTLSDVITRLREDKGVWDE